MSVFKCVCTPALPLQGSALLTSLKAFTHPLQEGFPQQGC